MSDPSPDTPAARLMRARIQAGYKTATDAARAFGWNENTYRSHENGERGLKFRIAAQYAEAFKTNAAYIIAGEIGLTAFESMTARLLSIIAIVNGLGPVESLQNSQGDLVETTVASSNFKPANSAILAAIAGNDMPEAGFFAEDLLIFPKMKSNYKAKAGDYALICNSKGEIIFNKVRFSKEGMVNVSSNPNEILLEAPKYILPLCAVIKNGRWKLEKREDEVARIAKRLGDGFDRALSDDEKTAPLAKPKRSA